MEKINNSVNTSNPILPQSEAKGPKLQRTFFGRRDALRNLPSSLDDNPRTSNTKKLSTFFKSARLPSRNILNKICHKTADNLSKVACGMLNKSTQPHGNATHEQQGAAQRVNARLETIPEVDETRFNRRVRFNPTPEILGSPDSKAEEGQFDKHRVKSALKKEGIAGRDIKTADKVRQFEAAMKNNEENIKNAPEGDNRSPEKRYGPNSLYWKLQAAAKEEQQEKMERAQNPN